MNPLQLDLRSYPGEASAHDHPHHQVILALEGALDLEIDGQAGRVDSAQGALVPAGKMHAFAGIGRNRFVTLDIARHSTPEPQTLLHANRQFFAVPRAVEHLLAYLESRGPAAVDDAVHVAPLLATALDPPDEAPLPGHVLKAVTYLRRHQHRPVGCADAARAAGVSVARLHAVFRQWLGMGPGRYLAELRLSAARDRLADGPEPIAEIALAAGFSEQSAFTRAFRRRYGETPAAYRRRLENRLKPR